MYALCTVYEHLQPSTTLLYKTHKVNMVFNSLKADHNQLLGINARYSTDCELLWKHKTVECSITQYFDFERAAIRINSIMNFNNFCFLFPNLRPLWMFIKIFVILFNLGLIYLDFSWSYIQNIILRLILWYDRVSVYYPLQRQNSQKHVTSK